MIIFYSLLIALCVYMELSEKINTENILNKIAIGLVIVGSCLSIYAQCKALAHPNHLVSIGVFLHFICELIRVNKRHNRRMSDRLKS